MTEYREEIKGFYFNSCNRHFIIELEVKQIKHNTLVVVYETGIPQNDSGIIQMDNGTEWTCGSWDAKEVFRIDVWSKYYFPTFNNENNQWYHKDEFYEDYIKSTFEVMQFALDKAIEKGEMLLY